MPNKRRSSGNILMTVLAVMFVLCTLAFALHWQQSRARAAFLREEAALEARQAAEYEVADEQTTAALAPPDLDVSVTPSQYPASPYDPKFGSKLFDSMPDLSKADPVSWDNTRQAVPGPRWTSLKPGSLNPGLALGRRRFLAISSDTLPYGALAPQGQVKLDTAAGYANPTFPETVGKDATTMYSAAPVRIGARDNVTVANVRYGEVYSLNGPFDVDQGSAVARQGFLPWTHRGGKDYHNVLVDEQVSAAYSQLSSRGQNKSANIKGELPSIGDVFGMLFGDDSFESVFGGALSLRQSLEFPFPMIPGGNELGIVTNIWLHMPYPPDGSIDQGSADQLNAYNDQLTAITNQIQEKQQQLDAVNAQLAETPPGDERDALLLQKATLEAQIADLVDDAQQIGQQSGDYVNSHLGASDDNGPDTRAQEAGMGDDGQFGWAYGPVFSKILDILGHLVSGQFDELAEDFVNRCRVVHFGPEDNPTGFVITDSSFTCPATFNVPSGRGFRFDGDMTIHGDLWVQKGATFMVSGNLTLTNPQGAPSDDLLVPQGRLCLEEGATVLVGGDLRCAGAPRAGSVLVAGPVNGTHGATCGILVQGNVDLPYGVFPAMTLDSLAGLVPQLADANHILTTIASNLAKAAGPFHRRKPYFARYATTFQIVKWPFPPAIIPMAIPLPTPKNVLNPVFSSMATIYQVQLNLVLGENFVTFTDWWFFGKGVVPMIPKVDPAALAGLDGLTLPTGLPDEDTVVNFLKDFAVKAGTEMITQLLSTVITNLIQSQMGFPMSLVGDFAGDAVNELTKWITEATGADNLAGTPSLMDLSNLADQIRDRLNGGDVKPMLPECPGLLLYSGRDLTVNSAAEVSPLAIGFLVARGTLLCNTEYLVGAAVSQTANVTAKNLLYVPEFTRVSLYLPRASASVLDTGIGWLDWALEPAYGRDFNSNQSVEVGPAVPHLTVEGWDG
ncbi:MAG: hypothetical protein AB1758_12100 [Candidatus Eremiobacterota bacterium]